MAIKFSVCWVPAEWARSVVGAIQPSKVVGRNVYKDARARVSLNSPRKAAMRRAPRKDHSQAQWECAQGWSGNTWAELWVVT